MRSICANSDSILLSVAQRLQAWPSDDCGSNSRSFSQKGSAFLRQDTSPETSRHCIGKNNRTMRISQLIDTWAQLFKNNLVQDAKLSAQYVWGFREGNPSELCRNFMCIALP